MPTQFVKKELANSITHGFGLLLSLIGVIALISLAITKGSFLHLISAGIYSVSLLMVYVSSTLYHSFKEGLIKQVLQVIDHISIYFLIAGSYTPFVLLFLDGGLGLKFMTFMWSMVAAGTVFKIFYTGKYKVFSLLFYLFLGWLVVFIAGPMIESLPRLCVWLIAIGGFFYTTGTIFYVWKKLTYHHAIWHLFVLAGSFTHYLAIIYAVARS